MNKFSTRLLQASLVALPLLALAPISHAQLKFEETEISHTATADESKFTATYKFENVGDKEVTVKKVNTSCGCTTAELEKKEYKPGEKGSLDVTFTYDDRKGFEMKTIMVETTSGGKPLPGTQLVLEVEIPEFVKIDLPLLTWESGAEPKPQTFTITTAANTPYKIVAGEFENPKAFTGDLKETTKANQKGRSYTFTVTPVSTKEFVKSIVYFRTDFPKDKPRSFKSFVMVKPGDGKYENKAENKAE